MRSLTTDTAPQTAPGACILQIRVGARTEEITERKIFFACLLLIGTGILLFFLATPRLSAVFLEYIFKFLPAMSDRGIAAIFDGNLLGDPRGRLVANLFGYMNVVVRRELLGFMPIHPTLSIAWLLYPAILAVFGQAVRTITRSWRAAAMATVLLAASPALLDFFVNYYIPAKPLVLFAFVTVLLGAAQFLKTKPDQADRTILGAGVIASGLLIGLLSDETAIFIAVCIPLMFASWLLAGATPWRDRLLFTTSFGVAAIFYVLFLLVWSPAVNRSLGQMPVDLPGLFVNGVYRTMFEAQPEPLGGLVAKGYSPFGLFQTIVSAHFFPLRRVIAIWTTLLKDPWRWYEILYAALLGALWLLLVTRSSPRIRLMTGCLVLAFAAFVLIEAVVILRLSPYIAEVNYYANLSSVFVALLVAVPLAAWVDSTASKLRIAVGWSAIAAIAIIEFTNFVATAGRHPMFMQDPAEVSWSTLAEGYREARIGHFAEWATNHPFPSRAFLWAFEAAVAERKSKNILVDLRPFAPSQNIPLALVDLDRIADPKIPPMVVPPIQTKAQLEAEGATPVLPSSVFSLEYRTRELRGSFGKWQFRWRRAEDGATEQLAWRVGIMRLWYERSDSLATDGRACPHFPSYNIPCPNHFYSLGDMIFGVDQAGTVQVILKAESPTL